jgi:pimeloyl-ACP methyl ester carboxylesterase
VSAADVRQYPVGCCRTTTRVLECGSGGVPLVFLHGVGARADRWWPALHRFAEQGRHCYAFDFPGHGLAGKPETFDYTVPGYARFTEALLDALGLTEAVLVGTSLGGHVAGAVAVRRARSVRALVLVGPMGMLPASQPVLDALASSIQDTTRAGIAKKLARLLVDQRLISDEWVDEEFRINNSPGAADAFAALARYFTSGINDDVVAEPLRRIVSTVPTLLVWGAQDVMVPTEMAEPARHALGGNVPLTLVPNTGHAPYFEAAAEFVEQVDAFLADRALPATVAAASGGLAR